MRIRMAVLLALAAVLATSTVALAEPPPGFRWHGSPWADTITITRSLRGGSGIERPVATFDMSKPKEATVCNGAGTDERGRVSRHCSFTLTTPADLGYDYKITEASDDGTTVRVTGCRVIGHCWQCQGASPLDRPSAPYEVVSPYNCNVEP